MDDDPGGPARARGTIRVLGEVLTQGFDLRATWAGSPVEREVSLSAQDLAEIAKSSRLNQFTLYRVPAALGERVCDDPAEHRGPRAADGPDVRRSAG